MNIPDRLPNPPRCENVFGAPMTLEDWKEYFVCREKYDVEMTDEERYEILDNMYMLHRQNKDDLALEMSKKLPMKPFLAFSLKCAAGFKAIQKFNLSEAKKVYPNEF